MFIRRSLDKAERTRAWRHLQRFQASTLDFMQLQRIPYRQFFRCACGGAEGKRLTADGITLGNQIARSYQQQPCMAEPASPPVAGAIFKERLLVVDVELRTALAHFSYSGSDRSKEGLTSAELTAMVNSFAALPNEDPARGLLPYVRASVSGRDGRVRAKPDWRDLLFSCSTTAPASALLPKRCFAAVQEMVTGEFTFGSMGLLTKWSPVLYKFVQKASQQQHPGMPALQSLLQALLKVTCSFCSVLGSHCSFPTTPPYSNCTPCQPVVLTCYLSMHLCHMLRLAVKDEVLWCTRCLDRCLE